MNFLFSVLLFLILPILAQAESSQLHLAGHWESTDIYEGYLQNIGMLSTRKKNSFLNFKSIHLVNTQRIFINSKRFNDLGLNINFNLFNKEAYKVSYGFSGFYNNYFSERFGANLEYEQKIIANLVFSFRSDWKTYSESFRNVVIARPVFMFYSGHFDYSIGFYHTWNNIERLLNTAFFGIGFSSRSFRLSYMFVQGKELNDLAVIDSFKANSFSVRYRNLLITTTLHRGDKRNSNLIAMNYSFIF